LPSGSEALEKAWKDGVLTDWFPHTCAERVSQVRRVDEIAEELSNRWSPILEHFHRPILASQPTHGISLAKLILFIAPEVQKAEEELKALKLSRAEIRAALLVVQRLPDILHPDKMSLRDQYFFFQATRLVFPTLILLARVAGVAMEAIAPLCDRYLNPDDPLVYPQPPISGNTLIEALNLPKGKLIGTLLTEIQIAQIQGKVTSEAEAIDFARHWLKPFKP
jgi:tRNA nucleotidyltransferase (CCA-adding enzyme)